MNRVGGAGEQGLLVGLPVAECAQQIDDVEGPICLLLRLQCWLTSEPSAARPGSFPPRVGPLGSETSGLEPRAVRVIINLAVVGYDQITVAARHRLRSGRREIDDGQAAMAESDTEVLLHLYAEKGRDMVHELRGMLAAAENLPQTRFAPQLSGQALAPARRLN